MADSVASRPLKRRMISLMRVTSPAAPTKRANSLARFHSGPFDGRIVHVSQLRQHAGANQRGLAAAGGSVNEHKMMRRKPLDYVVDHPLAAKKDGPLFDFEGP
jgi:hypothetical protein